MTAPDGPDLSELHELWPDDPVYYGEPVLAYNDEMTFAPGHPLRGAKCVLCGMTIGGRPFRFVQVIMCFEAACECGQLGTISRIVCTDHGEPDPHVVVPAILAFVKAAHPQEWAHGLSRPL